MITIFRKIRQKLINSGSVTKYLFYAIGEIALVMIGILLALQVNNWNEERKERNEEQYLLGELNKEFNTNLSLINRDFMGNKATSDAVFRIMELFDEPKGQVTTEIDSLLYAVFVTTSYDPVTGVIDEILSTGRLSVLQDDSLRYLISQWPSVLSNQQEDIEIRWTHFERFLLPAIIRSYPMKNINRHFDFSFWTDSYSRVKQNKSQFPFNPDTFFTPEMEGLLYVHSLNQDFILMNDQETQRQIGLIQERIKRSLN